ncbi:lysophosphatidic acid receptor 1-like [Branchiostoma floridae]|uniref:Lysophosphatidic acid receptor 1-like n=1 Tax=Branchiostoma floridae TaxID=7739 RepID=A0A9J7LRU7_BRAFL|nr:lysophosphatidic acid receptor 1-like [Branchiostoma floridae]
MFVGASNGGGRSFNDISSNTTMSAIARSMDFFNDVRSSDAEDNGKLCCQNDTVTSSSIGYNRHLLEAVFVSAIIAVLVNIVIIVAILVASKRNRWKPVYILLANLAMADVCRSLSIISIFATNLDATSRLDTSWTKVTEFFLFFSASFSVNSLLVLTLERYWFILHAFSYESVFANRAKLAIFVLWTWLWSGAFSAVALVTGKPRVSSDGHVLPGPVCPHLLVGFLVIIPIIAILSFNTAILCVVCRHLGFTTSHNVANSPPGVNRKTVVTVTIIIVVVLFSWVPQLVSLSLCTMGDITGPVSEVSMLFLTTGSVVNPLVYGLRLKKIREAVIWLLPCNLQNKVDAW